MQGFLTALIECSISMSVLALVLITLTPLLSKRYAAKWLYCAWLVIVVGLIIPFRLHFDMALIRMDAVPSSVQQILPVNVGNVADGTTIDTVTQGAAEIPWIHIIGAVWFAGTATFLIYHILRHTRFLRMVKRWSEQTDNPQMLGMLENIKTDMNIAKTVKLQICSCVSSPMMIGFLKPIILLPKSDASTDELPYILRHELVHFKRRDLWYKSLVVFATAIHWFNPVVYLMARAIASQCEISCDAAVVNKTDMDGRQRYSETIIGVIKTKSRVQTTFSTNFYGGKKGMKKKILSIMDTTKKKVGIVILALVIIGTMGTGVAFAARNNGNNDQGSYSTNKVLTDQEKEQLEQQNKKEIAEKYAMYEAFGLTYDQASDNFYYDNQLVRYFSDKLDAAGTYNSFTRSNGIVDLVAVRNSNNELIGITPVTQEEYNRRTESIKRAQDANVQGSSQENLNDGAVVGLTTGSENAGNNNIVNGATSASSEGDPNYVDNSLNAYINYGVSYDETNKQWIFNNKPIHFLSDGDNATFVDNSENALTNGILLNVVRKANGEIDHLVEITNEEAQALLN